MSYLLLMLLVLAIGIFILVAGLVLIHRGPENRQYGFRDGFKDIVNWVYGFVVAFVVEVLIMFNL